MATNRLSHLFKYDKKAVNKFSSVRSKEDALAVVREYISDYTEEELLRDVEDMQSTVAREGSLDAEQLESVVGGAFNWGGFISQVLPVVIGAGGAAWNAYQGSKGQ